MLQSCYAGWGDSQRYEDVLDEKAERESRYKLTEPGFAPRRKVPKRWMWVKLSISIVVIKHHDQRQHGRKTFILVYLSQS